MDATVNNFAETGFLRNLRSVSASYLKSTIISYYVFPFSHWEYFIMSSSGSCRCMYVYKQKVKSLSKTL